MNQRVLLDRLVTGGLATRPQLARDTGLSLPTVIAALNDLEGAGLVRPVSGAGAGRGRPAQLYEADPTAGAVAGVDIGHQWLHVLVTDLAGRQLSQRDARITRRTAGGLVEHIGSTVIDAVNEAGLTPGAVTQTVIGSPGVFDPSRRRVNYAANLPGWQRAGLAEALAARLGASVTIDNDANLAALAEYTYGSAQGTRQFVYITIGTGVGLGIVIDGQIYRGHTGSAGEVGYLPVGDRRSGRQHGQRQRGMLEETLAADAVVREAIAAGMPGKPTAEDVFQAARAGERCAEHAVRVEGTHLALLIASTCAFLDPELIVLGGGVGQNLDLLEPHLKAEFARITPMQLPPIRASNLGTRAVALGAVARGLELARESVFASRIERAGDGGPSG